MKKITMTVIAGLVATTVIGGAAYAKFGGDRQGRMIQHVSERLDLDTNQTQAFEALSAELKESMLSIRGDTDQLESQLTGMLNAETLDQNAMLEMLNSRADAIREHAPDVVAATAVFFDGLNVDQKQEVRDMADHVKSRRGHWRH